MTGRDITPELRADVFARCQAAVPAWRDVDLADVDFVPPKGFSSFTMGVHVAVEVEPRAVLYRHLDGKENAILYGENERAVFLSLGDAGIAPRCLAYEADHRIETNTELRPGNSNEVIEPAHHLPDALHLLLSGEVRLRHRLGLGNRITAGLGDVGRRQDGRGGHPRRGHGGRDPRRQ